MKLANCLKLSKVSFLLLMLTLVSCFGSTVLAQDIRKFEVSIAGISIGEMVAKRTSNGSETVYEIKSKVSFWFFGKVNLDYLTVSRYKGKRFDSSEVKSKTNRGDFLSTIRWTGTRYDISARNYKYEFDGSLEKAVFASAATLCFDEPTTATEMIAEAYGLVSKITKGKDYYSVTINGNTNKYYYENGKLVKAVMEFPIKNYVLKLKE